MLLHDFLFERTLFYKKRASAAIIIFTLFGLLTLLPGCTQSGPTTSPVPSAAASPAVLSQVTTSPNPSATPAPVSHKFTLSAVGDVLLHRAVYRDRAVGSGYDFRPMFEPVKPYMQKADITFANSESIMSGKELGISDFPQFGSPVEIGDALKSAGVDIVSMANNHSMDKREAGIRAAIQNWKKIGVQYVGANDSAADRDRIRIIEANGAKVAFLAYTYGTNGIPVPADKPYLVNLIDRSAMHNDIQRAKQTADVVVVSLHFGVEYQLEPNDEQKDLAKFAANEGADIILGHHPHVLQPAEWITRADGGKTFVIYSLGNFVAAQELLEPYRYIGGILNLEVHTERVGDKVSVKVTNPTFLPTYIDHVAWGKYSVVPLSAVNEQKLPIVAKLRQSIEQRMTQWAPDIKFIYP